MRIKLNLLLVFLLLISAVTLSGQNREEKVNPKVRSASGKSGKDKEEKEPPFWSYGFQFGAFFANPYPGNFYNGDEGNVNKLSYVMNNYYWYQEIKQYLGADCTVVVRELPQKMSYNTAITGGVFLRYNFNPRWSIFLDADYVKLKADDAVTVEVDPYYNPGFEDLRIIPISGSEERINFDLETHCAFPVYKDKMNLFLEGGFNMNYARVLKSFIYFDREYSLINIYGDQNYVPSSNLQEYTVTQGGIGFGLVGGAGIGFTFTRQVALELGGNVRYVKVNLEGYPDMKPSYSIYLRFLLSRLGQHDDD